MPLQGIEIVADRLLDQQPNVRYVRLQVVDVSLTLREIYLSLSNMAWISRLNIHEVLQHAYEVRATRTAVAVRNQFAGNIRQIDSDTGEYIVSESARRYAVDELGYSDIPLGEILKQNKKGNPGFDFFAENMQNVILFGEAKYRANEMGCYAALDQVKEFIKNENDSADLIDITPFLSQQSLNNFGEGRKGYMAAFTTWSETDEQIIARIIRHRVYAELVKYPELICIAIQLQP